MMNHSEFATLPTARQLQLMEGALKTVTNPAQVFGDNPKRVNKVYRRLSKVFHPDAGGNEAVFQMLTALYERAKQDIADGEYGNANVLGMVRAVEDGTLIELNTLLGEGDAHRVYAGTNEVVGMPQVAKVCISPDYEFASENEEFILRALQSAPGYDTVRHYFPQFVLVGRNAVGARVNVLSYDRNFIAHPSELASLKTVVDSIGFLDVRHIGWIWRKLLLGMKFAHHHGVIHACLTPDNILLTVHPDKHGVVLGGWIHASYNQSALTSISVDWLDSIYPPDAVVNERVAPLPALDVYMAAASMNWACPLMPTELITYFNWCMAHNPLARPSDMDFMLQEFDSVIFDTLGWKREFVPLNYASSQVDWSWFHG